MKRFVFIGAPGVGKGTFAKILCKGNNWSHFSLGDMLRSEVSRQTDIGTRIGDSMSRGLLIGDEIASKIIQGNIDKVAGDGFILDGYPRTLPQAESLESMSGGIVAVNIVLDQDVAVEKLLARQTCVVCGDSFNTAHIVRNGFDMPAILPDKTKCSRKEQCSPTFSARNDDTKAVIEQRFEEYKRKTEPLLTFYAARGRLINFEVKRGVKDADALLNVMMNFK